MQDEERQAAEQYRKDRQAADAKRNGFSYPDPETVYEWMEANRERILRIAIANGVSDENAPAFIELYKETVRGTPFGSPLDDVHGRTILKRIIDRVEEACKALKVKVRSGVVFGVAPEMGVLAAQTPVMMTEVSILSFSLHFVTFCNLISKALARSIIHEVGPDSSDHLVKVCFDPAQLRGRLEASPALQAEWASILIHFALFGAPASPTAPPDPAGQITRILILKAMEEFAVAHEYGHHVLEHGLSESSEDQSNHFQDEYEADLFARAICIVLGGQEEPFNLYASSGVGGVVILGMLDLVRRTRAMLESGSDIAEPRRRHPPYQDRIVAFDNLDPPSAATEYKKMRKAFADIVELVWDAVKPVAVSFYDSGYRPPPERPVSEGWLPLN